MITGTYSSPTQAGDIFSVNVGGRSYTIMPSSGSMDWTLQLLSPLSTNTYSIFTSLLDIAGNVSHDVTSSELTIISDATSPPQSSMVFDYIRPSNSYSTQISSYTHSSSAGTAYEVPVFEGNKSMYQTSWSWEHHADFVILPPIVRSLSNIIGNMPNAELATGSYGKRYADFLFNDSKPTVDGNNDPLKYTFLYTDLMNSPLSQKVCFDDKIKELLKDFGLF